MKNKLFYILGLSTAVLSSCHDDDMSDMFLNGKEKTPLPVSVSLNTRSGVQTRAANKEFDAGDKFFACLRHVIDNNGISEVLAGGTITADFHPRAYATFSLNASPSPTEKSNVNTYDYGEDFVLSSLEFGETTQTSPLGLYWDDFSNSSSDDKDLRTANHKLQSYYAYCFNGASSGTGDGQYTLTKNTGQLTWKVQANQNATTGFKQSDLLWSLTQTPVAYAHKSSVNDATRVGLIIPFTHAMSKISVTVKVDTEAGFIASEDLFSNVDVILQSFRTSCVLKPTESSEDARIDYTSASSGTITMHQVVDTKRETSCSYEAIVVPSTLTLNNTFATVVVDGNRYTIPVSASMLQTPSAENNQKGWGSKLTGESNLMQQGVNYALEVTLQKTKIGIKATILDWSQVTANGEGDIDFTDDVTSINITPAVYESDDLVSFDLWRSVFDKDNTTFRNYDENADGADGITKATTTTVSTSTDAGGNTIYSYTNNPEIYWKDGSTSYFFRALSKVNNAGKFETVNNSFVANQGEDLLWGTTSEHKGNYIDADGNSQTKDYAEGAAINPRTGTVPMIFKHAMSKITVNLQTTTGDDAVDLAGAKISIASLYNGGTINLEDGKIKDLTGPGTNVIPIQGFLAANDNSGTEGPKLSQYVVVPQSLTTMYDGETERTGSVSFYNRNELKVIEGVSYVISSLDPVYFSESEVIATNADLVGSVKIGDQLNYTEAQFLELKASEIPVSLYEVFNFGTSYTDFIASETCPFKYLTDEDYYTIKTLIEDRQLKHNDVSAKAYNSKLPGAIHTTDVKDYKPKTDDTSVIANPGDMKPGGGTKIVMLIMLADGTSYTLDLAKCVVDGSTTPLDTWVRGRHYTYTIKLKKEEISFRAMIKDWEEKTGSGNATLDWD